MFNRLKKRVTLPLSFFALLFASNAAGSDPTVYLANGIKIGEVSHNSAIIWTRVTQRAEPLKDGVAFQVTKRSEITKFGAYTDEQLGPGGGYGRQLPVGVHLEDAAYAVSGTSGVVRLSYQETGSKRSKKMTDWLPVDPKRDFTRHFSLQGLKPGTHYSLTIEASKSKSTKPSASLNGSFTTAPRKQETKPITFAVTTCSLFETRDAGDDGHQIYRSMQTMKPDFFVHAGDIVYYDLVPAYATHIDLARFKWNRMFALTHLRNLLTEVPAYWMKDDHDSWDNDCWPTMQNEMGVFTYEEGKQVFDEQVPMSDKRHFRTFRWGKDLQIWMVEVRDFRSPNFDPDGPEKSLWGKEQMEWFKRTVEASDATFKILISPTPIVGPDHLWKGDMNDNHVDPGWKYEGDRLRSYISQQKNMYYICGDRHWQYVSQDPETGIIEYGTGSSTDRHATPLANTDTSKHLYYRPHVGGFLSVTVDRIQGIPTATFRHHGVGGDIYHEDVRLGTDSP